jgi:CspA family cold shock protein
MSDNNLVRAVAGQVKWFDPARGFGFVVADDGGPDILLHANVLRVFGQSTVADSANIQLTVQDTDRGIQAVEVLSIEPPMASNGPSLEDLEHLDSADLDTPLEPARVLPMCLAMPMISLYMSRCCAAPVWQILCRARPWRCV